MLGVHARDEPDTTARNSMARQVTIEVGDVTPARHAIRHGFQRRVNSRLPAGAVEVMNRPYQGEDGADGDIILLVTKKGQTIQHVCLYTLPESLGKPLMMRMQKKNGNVMTKERHPGIEFVGPDSANVCKNNAYIRRYSWFANLGTVGSDTGLIALTKKLASEIVTSGAHMNFTLANVDITQAQINACTRIMNTLMGVGITFDD